MKTALLMLLLVGCASSLSSSDLPPTDGAIASESASTDDSSTTTDSTTTTETGPKLAFCQMTCTAPADCVATGAAFDADNYACESGLCRWLGCKSDAECESTFSSKTYGCFDVSGLRTCTKRCASPTDCVVAGSKAYDADNWSCTGGGCRWNGCNTDDECTSIGPSYVCRKMAGSELKNCINKCSSPADCATASAAFDADNYACEGGVCRYTGCNNDAECKASLMKSNYACR